MFLSRRKTLVLLSGGAIVAATATFGYNITRLPQTAGLPWTQAGQYADPRMRALSWAILAPNPHNRQPWMVDLSQPNTAVLYVDPDRLLPHTDPFNRQITIGLGCFLEVLRMATLQDGLNVDFDLFPNGSDPNALDTRPVAICRFAQSVAAPDPLFAHVPNRRSLKVPFDITRAVPDAALASIYSAAIHGSVTSTTNAQVDIDEMRILSREALRIEIETPRT